MRTELSVMIEPRSASPDTSEHAETVTWWRHPLVFVLIAGSLIRLYKLAEHSLWYDESTTFIGARFIDWKFTFLSASESRLEPLNSVLSLWWITLGESVFGIEMGSVASDFFLRALPVLFSVGLIAMTYILSMYLLKNRRAALVASWFIALSPFHVYYAQEFRQHAMYATLVTVAMYVSLRALEDGGKKFWISTVLVSTLAFYTYYFSVLMFIGFNVYALCFFTRYRAKIVPWTIGQLTILALIIPPALMALTVWGMHTAAEEHWFPHPTLKTAFITLKNLFAGYSSNIPLYWTLFFVGSAIIALGLLEMRKYVRQGMFLLCLSAFPILFQIAFWATQDFAFYTYRIQLAYTVPIYILMGAGVASIPRSVGRAALVGLFTLLSIPALYDVYKQNLHPVWSHVIGARYKVDHRSASALVKREWRDGDVLTHSSTFSYSPFREYYFPNEDQKVLAFTDEEFQLLLKSYPDEQAWTTIGFIPQRIEEAIAGNQRVWYVQSGWEPFNQAPLMFLFRDWLDVHATRVDQQMFDGIHVYLYELNRVDDAETRRYRYLENGRDHIDLSRDNAVPPGDLDESDLAGTRDLVLTQVPEKSLTFTNQSDKDIRLTQFDFPSIESIPALAFDREPASNVWRPEMTYFNQPAMRATVAGETSGSLTYSARLPSGTMHVVFRVNGRGTNQAVLDVELGNSGGNVFLNQVPISTGEGWRWVDLGEYVSDGTGVDITVTASTMASQEVQIEWERIAFVRLDHLSYFLEPQATTQTITKRGAGFLAPRPIDARRYDYEFQDTDENGYTLYYYR